jgi:hypothetical protein
LKKVCGVATVRELIDLTLDQKADKLKDRCVAFQTGVDVIDNQAKQSLMPRTLEETIAYENFSMLRAGTMSIGIDIPAVLDAAYEAIFQRIREDSFKKTDFAMDILAGPSSWKVPTYISEGLKWFERRLCPPKE